MDGGPAQAPRLALAGLGGAASGRLHPPRAPSAGDDRRCGGAGRLQKGGLQDALDALGAAHPDAVLELWAEDEHRVGLTPIQRTLWAPRGERPVAAGRQRYQWAYVFGFVHPTSGAASLTVLPTVSATAMSAALARFAADAGITATHRAALVLDRAGWHTATGLVLPTGVDVVPLPPASPELQPAERLWPLINEALANRAFADLNALEVVLVERCRPLLDAPAALQTRTHYHWWPTDIQPLAENAA